MPITTNQQESCPFRDSFTYDYFNILMKKNGQSLSEEFSKKCSGQKSVYSEVFNDILEIKITTTKQLAAFLKSYNLKNVEIESILSTYKILQKKRNNHIVKKLIKLLNHVDKLKANDYDFFDELLNDSMQSSSLLIRPMLESFIYAFTGNQARSKVLIRKLVGSDKVVRDHDLDSLIINKEEISLFIKNIEKILEVIKLRTTDQVLVEIYQKYIESLLRADEANLMSILRSREFLNSHHYGYPYAPFWYDQLHKRIPPFELNQFLDKVIKEYINEISYEKFWFLHELDLSDDTILSLIEKNTKYNNAWMKKYSSLYFIDRPNIRRKIFKDKKASFQLRRKVYLDLLSSGELISTSLFNLVSMGDRNNKLLWWIVL